MLLSCAHEPRLYRRGAFDRLRVVIAHLLFERVSASGDRRAAIAAMGEFYALTGEPPEPMTLGAAVDLLSEPPASDGTPETSERLLLAALRVGCAVARRACGVVDDNGEQTALIGRLDARALDERLVALLDESK